MNAVCGSKAMESHQLKHSRLNCTAAPLISLTAHETVTVKLPVGIGQLVWE